MTLRNTVAEADLTETGKAPISWANESTGARGAIISIKEHKDSTGARCRVFNATMERFDGVSLVTGETCMGPDGVWVTRTLKAV